MLQWWFPKAGMVQVRCAYTTTVGIRTFRFLFGRDAGIYLMSTPLQESNLCKPYCSRPRLSLKVCKHFSSGTFACGFEVRRGRKPPVS